MSRIRSVRDNLIGTEDADDLMFEIISVLSEGDKIPEVGNFYVFVYNPKTPNITYDQNPLVAVTEVLEWGFRGINFHWGQPRQYTWSEVAGGLYQVYDNELNDLDAIPFSKILINR
tara:strand:- start:1646 stop:1993 length:348 start_codon:yes stop_codon:yes gene_type:complete